MAATDRPLVWDFYRAVGTGDGVIGPTEYFDESAQTLWLDDGDFQTETADAAAGTWKTATWSSQSEIEADTITDAGMDHPDNSAIYFAVAKPTGLVFERYLYAMNASYVVKSWSWQMQNDNPIQQCSITMMNIGREFFDYDLTLFQPGSKMRLRVRLGDSLPYAIGIAFIDEVQYSETSETVSISGRNRSGYQIKETNLGTASTLTGTGSAIFAALMALAGVDDYAYETDSSASSLTFELKPEDTVQDGMDALNDYFAGAADGRQTIETPTGKIVNGYAAYRKSYLPNSYYVFDARHEVFSRKMSRNADAAYAKVYLTNKDDSSAAPVVRTVAREDSWKIPTSKIYFQEISGMTAAELSTFADHLAGWLKYTGVKEDITGPFRPQLLVNDIAQTDNGDNTATTIGIVTSVKHSGGVGGYTTQFTVDSGGAYLDDPSALAVKTAALGGRTRNMRVMDFVLNAIRGIK